VLGVIEGSAPWCGSPAIAWEQDGKRVALVVASSRVPRNSRAAVERFGAQHEQDVHGIRFNLRLPLVETVETVQGSFTKSRSLNA
jgi:hypothetical protein